MDRREGSSRELVGQSVRAEEGDRTPRALGMAPQGGGQASTETGKGPTDITPDMAVGPQARAGERKSEGTVWRGS